MKNVYNDRISDLQRRLGDTGALFVSEEKDVRYLTGFTGDSAYLLLTSGRIWFVTDGRYTEQARQELQIEAEITEITAQRRLTAVIRGFCEENHTGKLNFSYASVKLDFYNRLREAMAGLEMEYSDQNWISGMRMVKDGLEIETIRRNLILTETAYHLIVREIKPGMTEKEAASLLEYTLRKQGADRMSFDTIVASGPRSALPHGTASDRVIGENEVVLFDFGIEKDGYCSDFTRCYWTGKEIDDRIRTIHGVVYRALKAAQAVIKPGVLARDVHQAAWDTIAKAGFEKNFWHSTGHGTGLDIHEQPAISFAGDTVLAPGMLFTVEPGIYLPELGGIRLEDMVVVTRNGCEVLTSTDYGL